jgi:hypothetical protein
MLKELTKEDLQVIFDVLNVYDPNDIDNVYPEMGEEEFLDGVFSAWVKVLDMIRPNGLYKANQLTFDFDGTNDYRKSLQQGN